MKHKLLIHADPQRHDREVGACLAELAKEHAQVHHVKHAVAIGGTFFVRYRYSTLILYSDL